MFPVESVIVARQPEQHLVGWTVPFKSLTLLVYVDREGRDLQSMRALNWGTP